MTTYENKAKDQAIKANNKPMLNDSPTREFFDKTQQQKWPSADEVVSGADEAVSGALLQCHSLYPEMMEEYLAIEYEQRELFCKKMLDYGTGNISLGTNLESEEDKKVSLTGLWYRINDKISRLKNLVVLGKSPNVKGETIKDTYQDLSIYGVIAQLVIRNKWGK